MKYATIFLVIFWSSIIIYQVSHQKWGWGKAKIWDSGSGDFRRFLRERNQKERAAGEALRRHGGE